VSALHPNLLESDAEIAAVARAMRVVAVVGMKDESRPWEPAFEIPRMIVERGAKVIPVNPTIEHSLGRKAYAKLADVPERFDLVDVFRRPERIPALADEILALPAEQRPEVVWLQSGIRNDAAALKLAEAGIRVVQDACLGVIAARVRPAV
jgi:predicted CoA-binding protein